MQMSKIEKQKVVKWNVNSNSENYLFYNKAFKFFWVMSVLIVLLSLQYVFGTKDLNWLEKSLILISGIFFVAKNPIADKSVLIGFALILFSILFFGAITEFPQHSWGRTFNATLALLAILVFYLGKPTQEDCLFLLKTLANMTPILVIYGFLLMLLVGRPVYMRDHTGALRFGGGTIPAFLAAAAYTSTIAYSMLYGYFRKPRFFIMAFGSLCVAVLSGSRMPTVCAAICTFSILFYVIKNNFYRFVFIFLGGLAAVGFLSTFGSELLHRFSSQSTSGRDKLWNSIWAWVDVYPWTGVGYGHHMLLIPEYVQKITFTQATHNEYVRLIGELGYLGAAIFIVGLLMIYFFAPLKRSMPDYALTIVFLTTFALFSYSDNTLLSTYCMLSPLAFSLGLRLINSDKAYIDLKLKKEN